MNKERFIAIFAEHGNDREWAEICYARALKSGDELTEERVAQAAKDWTKYAEEGGF